MKNNNTKWCRASHVSQNFQFMGHISKVFSDIWFKVALTRGITKFFIHFNEGNASIYFLKNEIEKNSSQLTDKILKNSSWGLKLIERIEKNHLRYFDSTESIRKIDLLKQSDKKLLKILKDTQILGLIGHEVTGSISWQLDKDNKRFNNEIGEIIEKQINKQGKNFNVKVILPELTSPLKDTYVYKEQIDLLNIAKKIVKNNEIKDIFIETGNEQKIIEDLIRIDEKIYNQILKHFKNYRWLSYLYREPAYKFNYYISRLRDLAKDEISISRLLSRYKDGKTKTLDVRKIILKELDFNKKDLAILEFARGLSYIRELRKSVLSHGTFCLRKIYVELSKRHNVTLEQIRMMDFNEITQAINENKFDIDNLNKRIKQALFYYERGQEKEILTGDEAGKFMQGIVIDKDEVEESEDIEGTIASSGKVQGLARIVNNIEDVKKIKTGEILVVKTADFNLSQAINKVAGIISECGGLTCHAAIAAREINVPCLVGAEDASKLLKDGDEIELDAQKGVIKKL